MHYEDYLFRVDEDYVRLVNEAARERDGKVFVNGSLGHAIIIVEHMIAGASQSVSILSRNLDARVYGRDRVLSNTEEFLSEQSHEMRILLEERDQAGFDSNPFLSKFENWPNVELRFVPPAVQKRYDFHFLIADRESYRFEPDKSKPAAIVGFGETKGAVHLQGLFDRIWGQAETWRHSDTDQVPSSANA